MDRLERLEARLDTLRDRLTANRSAADLRAQISKRPWAAVGIAVAAGAVIALGMGRKRTIDTEDSRPALLATLGLIAWRFARRAAFDFAASRAQGWVSERLSHDGHTPRDPSRDPALH